MDPVPHEDEKAMLRLPEVADRLGVHYMTAYRYVRTGRLPGTRVGGMWLVAEGDLGALADRPLPGQRAAGASRVRAVTMLERRLLAGDEAGAVAVVNEALVSWASRSDVYMAMLVPALRLIGERWEQGALSVAEEHRATATALRLIGRVGPRFREPGRRRGSVVVGAPAGERHGIPVAIVADLLRESGVAVVELGPDVPPEAFVDAARHADRLVAVAVGATVAGTEGAITETTSALHRAFPGVPVILGGAAIGSLETARRLGGDRWPGPDAPGVAAEIRAVLEGHGPSPTGRPAPA